MRAVARTTLELGDLLEIPVGIAPATGSQEIKFETAFPDGVKRVQQFVHPERSRTLYEPPPTDDGDELDPTEVPLSDLTPVEVPEAIDATVKGVYVRDRFRVVPPSELEYAKVATALDAIELLEFIDYRRVPTARLSGFFFVQPDPGFAKPLRVVIDAMRAEGKAMLVKWSVRSRQRLGVIRARKDEDSGEFVLVLNGVVFANELRKPDAQVLEPSTIEAVDERAVNSAREIIRSLSGTGEALDTAEDDLPKLLTEVVERAHDGLYDDPHRVIQLAQSYRAAEFDERAKQLIAWAEQRWPALVEKRQEVTRVIAEGGADVGEKLAALVG